MLGKHLVGHLGIVGERVGSVADREHYRVPLEVAQPLRGRALVHRLGDEVDDGRVNAVVLGDAHKLRGCS